MQPTNLDLEHTNLNHAIYGLNKITAALVILSWLFFFWHKHVAEISDYVIQNCIQVKTTTIRNLCHWPGSKQRSSGSGSSECTAITLIEGTFVRSQFKIYKAPCNSIRLSTESVTSPLPFIVHVSTLAFW